MLSEMYMKPRQEAKTEVDNAGDNSASWRGGYIYVKLVIT
jgi:hypothetical protein